MSRTDARAFSRSGLLYVMYTGGGSAPFSRWACQERANDANMYWRTVDLPLPGRPLMKMGNPDVAPPAFARRTAWSTAVSSGDNARFAAAEAWMLSQMLVSASTNEGYARR